VVNLLQFVDLQTYRNDLKKVIFLNNFEIFKATVHCGFNLIPIYAILREEIVNKIVFLNIFFS
jgi:hypothetical protein